MEPPPPTTTTRRDGRRLTILYGSQTGTAQDVAEKLYRQSKCHHFSGPVQPMDGYDVRRLIDERFVVFVCSTQGQGDEPDNMRQFWRFLLRKSLPAESLRALHFAVLGLGDSSYDKFNFVAKRLNKRLQQLGARPIVSTGLADAQHDMGFNAVAAPWTDELWSRLQVLSPLPAGLSVLPQTPRPFRWHVRAYDGDDAAAAAARLDDDEDVVDMYAEYTDAVFDRPFVANVLSNERTTSAEHFQDVRLLAFDAGAETRWLPGDVLMLRPCNSRERVDELFALFAEHRLPFNERTVVEVREIDDELPVPTHLRRRPLTLRTIATQYWNLNACPRQRAFELLARNSRDELERDKLCELTTAEGEQDFFDYVTRPRRTILEVLHDFRHSTAQLDLSTAFELFEPIKLRSFSIASARESGRLELLVAVVEYRTKLRVQRVGLCSTWLRQLAPGARIRAVIKAGTIRMPADRRTPIVMVGPGTGLAMFRSILQERAAKRAEAEEGDSGRLALFFGCRNERADFHCEAELRTWQQSGMLLLFTAFSRDQEHKIYVQQRLREQHELLRRLLADDGGYVFVSGNAKNMPAAVRDALAAALGGAEAVQALVKAGRYQEETWG